MGVKTKSNYTPSGRDLFQTPRYATELLIPFLPKPSDCIIWECAYGEGAIGVVLSKAGYTVYGTDIREKYQESHDFLKDDPPGLFETVIVTNPPFSRKRQFYERCLEFGVPFALLVPADYSGWMIDAVRHNMCVKIVPTRRIDYITPSGKDASMGATADFHSLWLTHRLIMSPAHTTEVFVDLSLEDKKRIY